MESCSLDLELRDFKSFRRILRSPNYTDRHLFLNVKRLASVNNFNCLGDKTAFWRESGDGEFCDILVYVAGRAFLVHREILKSSSGYFRAMFSGCFCESQQTKVTIEGIDATMFSKVLQFMYLGRVGVSDVDALPLLKVALYLQVDSMVHQCEEFVVENVYRTNSIDIFKFADINNCRKLRRTAQEIIVSNFTDAIVQENFTKLDFEEVEKILSDGSITCGETEVFLCAVRWVKHDLESRSKHFLALMKHVCFPLISSSSFERFIDPEPLVKNNPEVLEWINKSGRPGGLVSCIVINRKVFDLSGIDQFYLI